MSAPVIKDDYMSAKDVMAELKAAAEAVNPYPEFFTAFLYSKLECIAARNDSLYADLVASAKWLREEAAKE